MPGDPLDHLPPEGTRLFKPLQVKGEIFQAGQVVHRQEIVDVRQRGLHAARQRLIGLRAQQWIQPDQPVAAALEAGDLDCVTARDRRGPTHR